MAGDDARRARAGAERLCARRYVACRRPKRVRYACLLSARRCARRREELFQEA